MRAIAPHQVLHRGTYPEGNLLEVPTGTLLLHIEGLRLSSPKLLIGLIRELAKKILRVVERFHPLRVKL